MIHEKALKGKEKKVICVMKDKSSGKTIKQFVVLRIKNFSYLIDEGSKDKRVKSTKKCVIKRKLKFENYRICLEVNKLENRINHQKEKNYTDIESLKKDHKEYIKNTKLILKTQPRFKSVMDNNFTDEINNITLFSNDNKRMNSQKN